MGIQVEFEQSPGLALRIHKSEGRLSEECLPKKLESGKTYSFLIQGRIIYYLEGEIPLVQIKRDLTHSQPIANITMLQYTHFLNPHKDPFTKGFYRIDKIHI